ncbi:hypothetical protein DS893_06325 [Vibrionales bacterium C3R12]|nr:hypothetical protein DS893_06325 [Vibrionales bacterium C3R12]
MIDFLIVEDSCEKYDNICKVIRTIQADFDIKRAENVADAITLVKKRKFSFLIVDIQLPDSQSENSEVNSNAGLELIKWIKHSQKRKKCLPPDNILILSQYSELIEKHSSDFTRTRVFSYLYSREDCKWESDVKDCIEEYILKKTDNIKKSDEENIIYSVHGINTYGEWQDELSQFIKSKFDGLFNHIPYKYQYFPIYSFLNPFLRKREVKRLIKDLEHCARRAPNATVHLVGHSFGTHVICEALDKITVELSPKIGNVVLVNSVIKSGYDWSNIVKKHGINKIVNECGINDRVLILSQMTAFGLGMAGRTGFKGKLYDTLTNRYFKGGHSSLFTDQHFQDWCTVLASDTIKNIDERGKVTKLDAFKNSLIIASPYVLGLFLSYLSYRVFF